MKSNQLNNTKINRRDFLKLLGVSSLLIPTSKIAAQLKSKHTQQEEKQHPNFIIIVFDALTAQNMGLYGYQRNTTPNIDEFARTSTVYLHHYSASTHTKPSTSSMLTGVYPWSHRAFIYYTALLDFYNGANIFSSFPEQYYNIAFTHNTFVTAILEQFHRDIDHLKPLSELSVFNPNLLPELFKNDFPLGFYATKKWRDDYMGPSNSLFVNPLSKVVTALKAKTVLEEYSDVYPLGVSDNQEGYLYKLEDATDWISRAVTESKAPYLGYFHLLPPHEAYRPRADVLGKFEHDNFHWIKKPSHFFSENQSTERLEHHRRLYDEYIALVDLEFGRLYQTLMKSGALENSYLILTSDHGQIFERGIHGHNQPVMYESAIHIPLIVRSPNQTQGNMVYLPTSNVDLVPTLIHLAGLSASDWSEGQLLPLLGGSKESERTIFSMEAKSNYKMKPLQKVTYAAIHWPYKYINYRGYDGFDDIDELYDIENDPEELNDLAFQKKQTSKELKELLLMSQSVAEKNSLGL